MSDEKIEINTASDKELRDALKKSYDKINQLESELLELKRKFNVKDESEKSSKPKESISTAKIVYSSPIQSTSPSQLQPTIKIIQAKISPDELIQYASTTAEKNSKGGLFGRGKVIEKPVGWEMFYYPYFDVEIEATVRETEKRGWFKKEQVTKTVKSRTGVDGTTGAIIDVSPDGISYKCAFLKGLDMDEVNFLYWVGSGTFTIKDLRGLGHSDPKSRRIADGLASRGILKRQNTRPVQYQSKYPYPYDPVKFISLTEQYHPVEKSITEKKIEPKFHASVISSHLERYWDRCNVLSSQVVYYPYYGVIYERENHTRTEVIDAVTGLRQEYVERYVNVEVKNKIG